MAHDLLLVALSALFCLLASFVALPLFYRAQVTRRHTRLMWLVLFGVTGGCAIWTTHLIVVLAYRLDLTINYNALLAALSLVVSTIVTTCAFACAVYFRSRWRSVAGGALLGGGIALTHYLSMSALELPWRMTWQPTAVAGSFILGIVFSVAAMTILVKHHRWRTTLSASLLTTMAIMVMHFTAMAGGMVVADPTRAVEGFAMSRIELVTAMVAVNMAMMGISLVGAAADRRLALQAKSFARESQLRESSLRLLFEGSPIPMWICDVQSLRFLAVNEATVRHYGYSREEFAAMTILDIRPPEFREEVRKFAGTGEGDHSATAGRTWQHLKADGSEITVGVYTRRLHYQGQEASLVAAIDMTERKRAAEKIAYLARHDMLTGLPNANAFSEEFATALRQAQTSHAPFAVLCLDLDHFKEINDSFGHAFGDETLQRAARRLQQQASDAFVARLSGDEFALLVIGDSQPIAVGDVADRLHQSLSKGFDVQGNWLRLELSIGAAVYPSDGNDETTLLSNANAALYRAKAEGRGMTCFFQPAMDAQYRRRLDLQRDLRSAIVNGELHLHYQPEVTIDDEPVGFEALLRWHHPTRGSVPPAIFVPIAEQSALIEEIGEWVLTEACHEAASWPTPLKIAVNLSPLQLKRRDLVGLVHSILLRTGLAPHRLELEITESMLLDDSPRALSILRRLKGLGVQIAMDDFGTGYSSLSYLQSFPFDKIKINGSFISNLGHSAQSAAIVRVIIGLGRALDLPVVAEGVETEEQFAFLARESCNQIQGYFVGRPRPISAYADIVGRQAPEVRVVCSG